MWGDGKKNTKKVTIDVMNRETKDMLKTVREDYGYTATLIVQEVVERCVQKFKKK